MLPSTREIPVARFSIFRANVIGIAQATAFRTGSGQRIQGRQMGVGIQEVEDVWRQLKKGEKLNKDSDYWFERRSEED